MNHGDQLAAAVAELEQIHETARTRLAQDMPAVDPYTVVDHTGRTVLLDSLTAIVNARAVLAESASIDTTHMAAAVTVHPGDKLLIGLSSSGASEIGAIVDAIKATLPGVEICVMEQVSAMAVVRGGGDTRA